MGKIKLHILADALDLRLYMKTLDDGVIFFWKKSKNQ